MIYRVIARALINLWQLEKSIIDIRRKELIVGLLVGGKV